MEGYLISWILYNLWIVFLLLYAKSHSYRFLSSRKVGFFTFFILFLIIVFGEFSGDYRHYEEIIENFSMNDEVASNFEPFYIWLTKVTGYNITVFRSIIGFVIIIAVYYCFRIFKELNIPAIFLYTLIPFYFVSNVIRQGMANSICLLGIFLLFSNKNRLLAIILIIVSFFLHKSSFLVLPALIFLFIPLKRKNVFILITLLFPLIYVENILLIYLADLLLGNGVISFYMNINSADTSTFLMRIMNFVLFSIIFILSYLSLKRTYKRKDIISQKPVEQLTRLLFGCCYMYIIYSGLQLDANYVGGRFAPFMYVPLVIVMMKAYGVRILKNQVVFSLLVIYYIFINLQIYRWFLAFF